MSEPQATYSAQSAPRITLADIEANIASEWYFTGENGARGAAMLTEDGADLRGAYGINAPLPLCLLTFCVLVMKNGHTVSGEAHCQDPEKFDAEIGRSVARQQAIEKVWPMMVYAQRNELSKS